MAEFCKECLSDILGDEKLQGKKFVLSKEIDLCENCGMMKPVVVRIVNRNPFSNMKKRFCRLFCLKVKK